MDNLFASFIAVNGIFGLVTLDKPKTVLNNQAQLDE
jgi:hypothetical protein